MIVVRALVPVSTALAAVSILLGMGLFLAAIVRVVVRRIAVQVPGAVLALSAGITAVIALGMTLLGKTLAETGTADQAPDLNSLILALWGVGESLWPVPAVLVVGASVVWATPIIRRERAMPRSVAVEVAGSRHQRMQELVVRGNRK